MDFLEGGLGRGHTQLKLSESIGQAASKASCEGAFRKGAWKKIQAEYFGNSSNDNLYGIKLGEY